MNTFLEISVTLEYDWQPEEEATRNYPGCPAAVENLVAYHNGKELVLTQAEYDELEEVVLESKRYYFEGSAA